jgi:glycosyltransferase involved in cell wall biosynthesis
LLGENIHPSFPYLEKDAGVIGCKTAVSASSGVDVSVIIPVYNAASYIGQCLDSVLGQTGVEFEAICVDGCGSDESMKLVEGYARKDPRVRIIRQPSALGPGFNRNRGVENARGEYLTFVDADDWILPGTLADCLAAARTSKAASVCFKYLCYLENTGKFGIEGAGNEFNRHVSGFIDDVIKIGPVTVWGKLFRTEAIVENGIRCRKYIDGEDAEFFFKFFSLSPHSYLLDEYLYVYRQRNDSAFQKIRDGLGDPGDLVEVLRYLHDFMREKEILERRETEWQGFMARIMEDFIYANGYKDGALIRMRELLADTGFPTNYRNGKYFGMFKAVWSYRGWPWWFFAYRPLLLLCSLLPFPGLRRRWRYWLKVNCLELPALKRPEYDLLANAGFEERQTVQPR